MRPADCRACWVGGLLVIGAALFIVWMTCRDALFGWNSFDSGDRVHQFAETMMTEPSVLVMWIVGNATMIAGVFLCVKARLAPARFWSHSGHHLLYAMGIASVLSFLPFTHVVLMRG